MLHDVLMSRLARAFESCPGQVLADANQRRPSWFLPRLALRKGYRVAVGDDPGIRKRGMRSSGRTRHARTQARYFRSRAGDHAGTFRMRRWWCRQRACRPAWHSRRCNEGRRDGKGAAVAARDAVELAGTAVGGLTVIDVQGDSTRAKLNAQKVPDAEAAVKAQLGSAQEALMAAQDARRAAQVLQNVVGRSLPDEHRWPGQ